MTSTDPGTGPVGPQPDPGAPVPAPQAAVPGPWTPPQQPGPWAPPQQPGAGGPQPSGGWAPQPGAWAPSQGAAPAPGGVRRWLRVGVPVAVAGVVGLGTLGGWLGRGDPAVGDCVQMVGATSFDVVDCDSAESEYRIVGIEDEEMDHPSFMADPDTCLAFPSTEVALWIGGLETEPGTVFCAEPTGAGL
ncbi:hypothetical protein SAMN05660209_00812 [Geodermatophilus africanus]|uniref:Uncharacterized protein n=1 Tax=Geodermatophilus africanus TaxID=1137993 RepID=A0A1H3D0K1_9ACTN|nr:hypothetical protein [Geodermatophilus africanus]SDX59866.1 hypothetical protein SAMN05660209_00812 [Geodermatophilus africanus]